MYAKKTKDKKKYHPQKTLRRQGNKQTVEIFHKESISLYCCHKLAKIGLRKLRLSHTQDMEKQTISKVMLTQKEAEEYCAYKRQKKISEIMAALRRTESELTANDSAVRLGEQALRLRQEAVKMTPSDLLSRGDAIRRNGVKIDCIVGGDGETFASVKAYEAKRALKEGAKEITLRITPSLIVNGRYTELRKEIKMVKRATRRAVLKVRVEKTYPQATLERLARICSEIGVSYFSLPYFNGCERLQTLCKGGCLLELSGIDSLSLFKEMARAGMGRMIIKRAWELYGEWLKEVENITVEKQEPATLPSMKEESEKEKTESLKQPLLPAKKEEACPMRIEEISCS